MQSKRPFELPNVPSLLSAAAHNLYLCVHLGACHSTSTCDSHHKSQCYSRRVRKNANTFHGSPGWPTAVKEPPRNTNESAHMAQSPHRRECVCPGIVWLSHWSWRWTARFHQPSNVRMLRFVGIMLSAWVGADRKICIMCERGLSSQMGATKRMANALRTQERERQHRPVNGLLNVFANTMCGV